jgi:hypothetical protein
LPVPSVESDGWRECVCFIFSFDKCQSRIIYLGREGEAVDSCVYRGGYSID